jgi:Tol biopolymer transport system component
VWVANSADGSVSRIAPETGTVTKTIMVGDRLGGIAYGAGSVWVTTQPSLAKDRLAGTLTFSDAGDLILQNADGSRRRKLTTNGADRDPSWSPDGSTIVFARGADFGSHLFTISPDDGAVHQLTTGPVKGADPVWSPDGRYIAFERGTNDRNSIWVVRPDGTGLRDITPQNAAYGYPTWTPDSSSVTACRYTLPNFAPTQLMSFNMDGRQSRSLWSVPGTAFAPVWSPSGDLIAYGDNASGVGVYVTGGSGGGFTKLSSLPPNAISGGRVGPAWSPDGSAIAFGGAGPNGADIYVINADGTGLSRLTGDGRAGQPDWRPTR